MIDGRAAQRHTERAGCDRANASDPGAQGPYRRTPRSTALIGGQTQLEGGALTLFPQRVS